MNWARRLAYIFSLAATIILASIAPRAALAQLNLGVGGSLVVNITAPSGGANVTGTIAVRGSYTTIGALTVRDVQFKLDGADLGAPHQHVPDLVSGTASFEDAWDTLTASNGTWAGLCK